MNMKEIKEMTDAEIDHQQEELLKEKFKLRIQAKTGQLEKPARIRHIRKDIARIKTEKTARTKAVKQQ